MLLIIDLLATALILALISSFLDAKSTPPAFSKLFMAELELSRLLKPFVELDDDAELELFPAIDSTPLPAPPFMFILSKAFWAVVKLLPELLLMFSFDDIMEEGMEYMEEEDVEMLELVEVVDEEDPLRLLMQLLGDCSTLLFS